MSKKQLAKIKTDKISGILVAIGMVLVGVLIGLTGGRITAIFNPVEKEVEIYAETEGSITLSEDQPEAVIETEDGNLTTEQLPVVEQVSGDEFNTEEGLDLGQGAYYDYSTPTAWKNATLGQCIDFDGKWGSQCVDAFATFHYEYTGRWADVCGTGAARGLWKCKENNAGDEYDLITDVTKVQAGDWLIFDGGKYGHVGMAMGPYNNGYVALLGENQGGAKCIGGGAATNIINMSTKTFLGAFRPKIYIAPEPEPTPAPVADKCQSWVLKKGDTLGKIMKECEGKIVWGPTMNEYAKTWIDKETGQVVYDGWHNSENGVGLYAGHEIKRK